MGTPARGERYRIKRVLTQISITREISKDKEQLINTIIKHLENNNYEQARQLIKNNFQEDDIKEEVIRKVVNSRSNEAVTQLLKIFMEFSVPVDSVDGGNNGRREMKEEDQVLSSAIVQATLNDDPETLEAILEFGGSSVIERLKSSNQSNKSEKLHRLSPMVIACVEEFYRCVKVLYRQGLRVELCNEDQKQVDFLITMNHVVANDFHLYYSMYFGSQHVNFEAELGAQRLKRQTSYKKRTYAEYLDPVDRFLKFRAFASPIYISLTFDEIKTTGDFSQDEKVLTASDPIRKAFACATYSKYLSTMNTQQSDEYKKVGKSCIAYTEDLLDQCEDMDEVKLILNYSNSDEMEECENTNWNIALWEGHKEFVSHHYYQQFIWEKMTGDHFDWFNYFFFWKILLIPAYLVLFLLYPFVIFIDFFREGDILFAPPTVKKIQQKKKPSVLATEAVFTLGSVSLGRDHLIRTDFEDDTLFTENRFFAFFREKIHRPFFRIFVHIAIEALFILSLCYSLVDPKDKKFTTETHFYDYTTYGMFITFFFENIVEVCRLKWKFFSSFWNAYSLFNFFLFALGGLLSGIGFSIETTDNRNEWSGNHPANVGATLFAIASTMAVVRSIRWFLLIRKVGPVIICVIRVLKDVAIIFLLFIILYIGFSLAMYAMYKPFREDRFRYPEQTLDSASSTFSNLFWRFFDPGEPGSVTIMSYDYNKTEIDKFNETVYKKYPNNTEEREKAIEDFYNKTVIDKFNETVYKKYPNDTEEREKAIEDFIAEGTQSLEFSHLMGVSFWAVYQGIVAIILINVLIALMNTTYTKISEEADIEWKYSKSFMYAQFLSTRAALPPPFRWFYYLALFVRWVKKSRKQTVETKNILEKQKYFELLSKLVKTKMQLDIEDSIEDDFDDLRKDLKNVLNNEVIKKIDLLERKNTELSKNINKVTEELVSCKKSNSIILTKLEEVLSKLSETNA